MWGPHPIPSPQRSVPGWRTTAPSCTRPTRPTRRSSSWMMRGRSVASTRTCSTGSAGTWASSSRPWSTRTGPWSSRRCRPGRCTCWARWPTTPSGRPTWTSSDPTCGWARSSTSAMTRPWRASRTWRARTWRSSRTTRQGSGSPRTTPRCIWWRSRTWSPGSRRSRWARWTPSSRTSRWAGTTSARTRSPAWSSWASPSTTPRRTGACPRATASWLRS